MLTLCPYLLKPIAEINDLSDEHIIPHAMGGSNSFVLKASKTANENLGSTVDNEFIHDPLLRMLAASQGIRSRNGEITANIPGTIAGTNDEIITEFKKSGLGVTRFKNMHIKDTVASNRLIGLRGFDNQVEKELGRLTKNKKMTTTIINNNQKIDNPCVLLKIESDTLNVQKGLAKIAYLMTCRTFGNEFVLSQDARAYLTAIHAKNLDDFEACGLHLLWANRLPMVLLPEIDVNQHLVACYRMAQLISTTVMLFGGSIMSTFAFPAKYNKIKDLDGVVVINDSLKRTIIEQSLKDATSVQDKIQKMIAYNNKKH